MKPATYRREDAREGNWKSNRKWFGLVESRLSPESCFAARERGKTAVWLSRFWIILPSIPHARAAGAPTGRSFFWFTALSPEFSVLSFPVIKEELAAPLSPKSFLAAKELERTCDPQKTKKGAGASPLLHN